MNRRRVFMPRYVVFLCCLLLGLNACRSVSSAHEATLFETAMASHPALASEHTVQRLPLSSRSLRDTPLDPLMAQQLALVGSPRIRAALAGLGVVSLLANPGFSLKAISPEGNGVWKTEFGLSLGLLDWMMRPLREQVADSDYAASQLQGWLQVRDALLEVQQAYFSAVADRQRAAVMDDMRHVAGLNADMAVALREAGNLSELATLRHLAEADRQRRAADEAAEQAAMSLRALNRLLGLPADMQLSLPTALPAPVEDPAQQLWLVEQGLQRRVEPILIQRQKQALLDEQRRVARQRGVASVDVGVLAERESDGDWHPGLRAGLQLPIFDRGDARQSALLARWEQLEAEHEASRLQIEVEVLDAWGQMALSGAQIMRLQEDEIPRWQRMIELALREYNFMLSGSFDLLTVKQHSLAAQLDLVANLEHYWNARAALDLATGNALDEQSWPIDGSPAPTSESHSHGGHQHD